MFVGFAGRAWSLDKEFTLGVGERAFFEGYTLTYAGPRMETDAEKRMIFADLDVTKGAKALGRLSPAKFIYRSMGDAPATKVSRHVSLRDDLYVVVGMVNPTTRVAAFQMHLNTLISFIWFGAVIVVLGSAVAVWPEHVIEERGAWSYVRATASIAAALAFSLFLAGGSARAYESRPEAAVPLIRLQPAREALTPL
jgi:cytochrome c-type biogenesis protein CcmF